MTLRSYLFSAVLCALFATNVHAIRPHHVTATITLNDGSKTKATYCGDENFTYYLTDDGQHIVNKGGEWYIVDEQEFLLARRNATMKANAMPTITADNPPFPCTGTPKVMVIMAEFLDCEFTYTAEDVNKLLNGTEYFKYNEKYKSISSVAEYFNYCSGGKFRPQFDVVGKYKLSKKVGSYIDYARINMVRDACQLADKDVDFKNYDSDNDKKVDAVIVLFAGHGGQWGNPTPRAASYYYNYTTQFEDGYSINRWLVTNELFAMPGMEIELGVTQMPMEGIGSLCHELCHCLGLPDIYPTENNWTPVTKYDNQSMQCWDLMDYGSNLNNCFKPLPLSAIERHWFGWTNEIEDITTNGEYVATSFDKGSSKSYRILNPEDPTENEYYILENIQKDYSWYYGAPGSGLLVTHIDYDADKFSNFKQPNNVQGHPRMTVLAANGIVYSTNRLDPQTPSEYRVTNTQIKANWAANLYPGSTNTTTIEDWKEYNASMSAKVTNITVNLDNSISFTFNDGKTAVSTLTTTSATPHTPIYTLDGRFAGYDSSSLPKGIYVRGNRKFAKTF